MKLSVTFRQIAKEWEQYPKQPMFDNGICRALAFWCQSFASHSHYVRAVDAMHTAELFAWYLAPPVQDLHERWEPRATFCLLMAHWLEDQGR